MGKYYYLNLLESVLEEIEKKQAGVVVNFGKRNNPIWSSVLNKSYTDHLKAAADAKKAGQPPPQFPPPSDTHIPPVPPPPKRKREPQPTAAVRAHIQGLAAARGELPFHEVVAQAHGGHKGALDIVNNHPMGPALLDVHRDTYEKAVADGHHSVRAGAMAQEAVTDMIRNLKGFAG